MSKFRGFKEVELRKPERSTFDLSHEKRVSSRIGRLTPVFISETLPNDTFFGSTEVLIKLAPMIAPIFQRLNLYVHFFYIPIRQLWEDWELFITGGRLGPGIDTPPVPPWLEVEGILVTGQNRLAKGSLADNLGVPPIPDADSALWANKRIHALPFLAWYKVWMDYYRDRNFVADGAGGIEFPVPSGDLGQHSVLETKRRAWEADYFTTAATDTQRGTEVLMPLEGTGTVTYRASSNFVNSDGQAPTAGAVEARANSFMEDAADVLSRVENIDQVILDESSVSINDFRRAVALQKWMERNQLAGSRYNESIMAHFARKTSDGRLQRAEYLGGGKAVVQVSEIMTTAYSEDALAETVPPGSMAGRGSTYSTTNKFSYNCEEHGFVIGILSVMPTSGYNQGWPRMFFARNTFLDYPWPSFAHLGEQPVHMQEIFAAPGNLADNGGDPDPATSFGYQSRYSDWKFMHNGAHGDFRDDLDYWHLVRKFATQPELGEEFITIEDALQDRIFNVTGVDTLWMYIYNSIKVKRSLPYYGTPQISN